MKMIESAKKAAIEAYDKELESWLQIFLDSSIENKVRDCFSLSSSIFVEYFKYFHNHCLEIKIFGYDISYRASTLEDVIDLTIKRLIKDLRKDLPKRFDQDDLRDFIEELIS